MLYLLLKAFLTGVIVIAIAEAAKRSSATAALIASLPLTSILAMIWLYQSEKNLEATRNLSQGIFWMVLPSLVFFLAFPILVKNGFKFYPALLVSSLATTLFYAVYIRMLSWVGIQL